MNSRKALFLAALLPLFSAQAQLAPGRYQALYPALYLDLTASHNGQSKAYDAQGREQNSATPTYGAGARFPTTREDARLQWFFPFFEASQIPLISSRLWTARATLGLVQTRTEGGIADYAEANGLVRQSDGVSDLLLEFGPVLAGSADWRNRESTPYSLIAVTRFHLPVGARDPDSPNNAGSNVWGFGLGLGGYWRPHPRLHLDLGVQADTFSRDSEPAFGAQTPSKTGSRVAADFTASARLFGGVYASAGVDTWRQSANSYEKVRFANNPPKAATGMDIFPDPAPVRDGGSELTRVGAGLSWFARPRLRLNLSWAHPVAGKSGEFDLHYLQQMQRCIATNTCNPQPAGSAHVDGLGSARSYADDSISLSLGWQFSQGDFYSW